MGGEWLFSFLGDPATIDVKKYQEELFKIRQEYRNDHTLLDYAKWFNPTECQKEPADNIFAKFIYKCEKHTFHSGEPGVNASKNGWWVLYWDPSKLTKEYWGNIHARCWPRDLDFVQKSVTMQKRLAINFPEHFQVYLGDGVDGHGDFELYWP